MRYFIFAMGLALAMPAYADDHCREIADDQERLSCYDMQVIANEDCIVEHLRFSMRGTSVVTMQGRTSCNSGKITYSIFAPDGTFLASGFHYFDGFAFVAYPDVEPFSGDVNLEYVIEPQ